MPDPTPIPPSDMRRDYKLLELHEADALPDPIQQFGKWFEDARAAGIIEPTVMTLATADATGRPAARIVLLKGFDARGFAFYTNKLSQKGKDLRENPRACLVFFWEALERQVRIDGSVVDVSREEAEQYYHSRPVNSQIGAWVSNQSSIISSRDDLNQREVEMHKKFDGQTVPMPDYWGGYRVIPEVIEFWQGRPSRLHDRLCYRLTEQRWNIERLAP